jgi:hypothetical protein
LGAYRKAKAAYALPRGTLRSLGLPACPEEKGVRGGFASQETIPASTSAKAMTIPVRPDIDALTKCLFIIDVMDYIDDQRTHLIPVSQARTRRGVAPILQCRGQVRGTVRQINSANRPEPPCRPVA